MEARERDDGDDVAAADDDDDVADDDVSQLAKRFILLECE